MAAARVESLLRLADNALVLSQRLGEWCGHGPALEEDMALTNTALDLLGEARLWLSLAAELRGEGDEDTLAFLREQHEFRNAQLVELPNGGYADTLARQFLFDAHHHLLLRRLQASPEPRVAGIAAKTVKEAAYHLRRSSDLVVRLGDGTGRSHALMQAAIDTCWPYTGELFAGDVVDRAAAADGYGIDVAELRAEWLDFVHSVLDVATLAMPPASVWMHGASGGGRQGIHTEHLSRLLAEMQSLHRAHPGARW